MAEDEHTHSHRRLTLEDVQTIIGRAIVDESFREEFTKAPLRTLSTLGISTAFGGRADEEAVRLVESIAAALAEGNRGAKLQDVLDNLRSSYLDSTDGIIRPRCG